MKIGEFDFVLPSELIAQRPSERGESRLLRLNRASGQFSDSHFKALPDFLNPNDLLIFNDTKVIPARLFGTKISGGKVEILIERVLAKHQVLAQIRASKTPKINSQIFLTATISVEVLAKMDDLYLLQFPLTEEVLSVLERIGHVPLPPYITRSDTAFDKERYQTVFAVQPGAVAAPTAGLHFNHALLAALKAKGVAVAYVTLHVGAGTFQPIRVDDISHHQMHKEFGIVTPDVCALVKKTKAAGGRVIAVGTTSLRILETATQDGDVQPFAGDTQIFIYPGYQFQLIDGLITNFHLPRSSLLLLVSAFAGKENILQAYAHAVDQRYRFFSYGDGMFIA